MKAILIAALVLGLSTSPALARKKDDPRLGKGDYMFAVLPEQQLAALYPEDAKKAIVAVNQRDFDAVQIIDGQSCRPAVKAQKPSMLKDVAITALRNAPGAIIGTVIGAQLGGFTPKRSPVSAVDYGIYSAGPAIGSSIGAGISAHEMGKHSAVASCMTTSVAKAQQLGYVNKSVVVFYSPFPTRGKPVRRSQFAAITAEDVQAARVRAAAMSGDSDIDDTPPPPPGG